MISPRSDRAKYRALADDLKRQIESGELAPGALLPSEAALEQETGMSRITIRQAIKHLRRQGLVETVRGSGTTVREPRPAPRLGRSRYLADADPHSSENSFTGEQRISGADRTLDRDYRVAPADERQAELLGIE
ncbi:MAG: GntR family transcriptional regulator, partial [Micromonosporaceae bacterium]